MHKKEDLLKKAIWVLNNDPTLGFAEICKQMKVARATVYKSFSDKQDLLFQISDYVLTQLEEMISELKDNVDLDSRWRLDLFIKEKVVMIENYYFLYSYANIIADSSIENRYNKTYRYIGELVQDISWQNQWELYWSLYALDGLFYAGWYALRDNITDPEKLEKQIQNSFYKQLDLW